MQPFYFCLSSCVHLVFLCLKIKHPCTSKILQNERSPSAKIENEKDI